MTPEQRKRFKLKVIQEMNSRIAASHNNLFKPNATEVTMPLKEYEGLIKAQDSLNEMMRGISDGNAYKESQKLKLFHVFVTFPQSMAANAATMNKIEMTILATNQREADIQVTRILEHEGYTDLSATLINVEEIKGPFESGFLISRYGG